MKRMLAGVGAAGALFAAFVAAPTLIAPRADAGQIVIAPPTGAPMSFADLIQRVSPAVVSVTVRQKVDAKMAMSGISPDQLPPGFEEFFKQYQKKGGVPKETTGLGSGFFISDGGIVVTNHHVVDGATEIMVKTNTGKEYPAEIVGSDQLTDVAVLRLKSAPTSGFPYVSFDRNADLRVGDWVVAVGNPFGLEGTATAGIVSAKGRRDVGASSYVDFVQIDAPINRGNSGGPTFDLQGRVVGVNSAIFSPTGGSVGIGFAIPSETAAVIVDQLLKNGKITRGWLGVQVQGVDKDIAKSLGLSEPKGAMVAGVVPSGPASKAGLQQGDLILSVEGKPVEDSRDLTRKVGAYPVGGVAKLNVLRDGKTRTIKVKMAERPAEEKLADLVHPGTDNNDEAEPKFEPGKLGLGVRPVNPQDRQRLDLSPSEGGLVVTTLEPDADLARKGLRPGDVILEAGGQKVRTPADLTAAVAAAQKAGKPVLLHVEGRGGRRYVAADVG